MATKVIFVEFNDDVLEGPVSRKDTANSWIAACKIMWIDPNFVDNKDFVEVNVLDTDTIAQFETKYKAAVQAKAITMGRTANIVLFPTFKKL